MKNTYFAIIFGAALASCVGAPEIYFAGDSIVTVRHYNSGMNPVMTPEMREMAASYCKKKNAKAVYTGSKRLRLSGWEEYDFECVDQRIRVENSGSLDVRHSGSIEIK